MPLKLPYLLDGYELFEKLGEGGMAEVYRARYYGREQFQKEFAIKLVSPHLLEEPSLIGMLIDEANIQSKLEHDNIVKVFELGAVDEPQSIFFVVMEFVKGIELEMFYQKIVEGNNIPVAYRLYIVHEVLKGLQYAHSKRDRYNKPLNIVHRDISPQNILISNEGRVKIADFGIARAKLEFRKSAKTEFRTLKGKYEYMSPEQAAGVSQLDHRTDLFATGVLLYELLTGKRAFKGTSDLEILDSVRRDGYDNSTLQSIDQDLATIVKKALERAPNDRYQSAQEFAEAIWKYMQAHSLYITDQNLGSLLESLFPDGKDSYEQHVPKTRQAESSESEAMEDEQHEIVTKILPNNANPIEPSLSQPKAPITIFRWVLLGLVGILSILVFIYQFYVKQSGVNVSQLQFSGPAEMVSAKIPLGPEEPHTAGSEKVEQEPAIKLESGTLSVVATPWAYINIGHGISKETPFVQIMKPGSYPMTLWRENEGEKMIIKTEVQVYPARITRCFTNFEVQPKKIVCD